MKFSQQKLLDAYNSGALCVEFDKPNPSGLHRFKEKHVVDVVAVKRRKWIVIFVDRVKQTNTTKEYDNE